MATKGKLTRSQRFDVERAKVIVAQHFDAGASDSIMRATIEQAAFNGYEILHGMVLGREDRIELLEALAVLERAGNYQPQM